VGSRWLLSICDRSLNYRDTRPRPDTDSRGLSYLLDQNHDLLGEGFYTDLKAYASAYYYDFETNSTGSGNRYANGAVFLSGLRFSFF
jgi:hypothetical protein